MPFAQAEKPPNSFAAELEKGHIVPLADTEAAKQKTGAPTATQKNAMYLDSAHDQEIKQTLDNSAKARFNKLFDDCKPIEKAETIWRAMKGGRLFGFTYVQESDGPPKTVEELYLSQPRIGDCEEMTRFYIAVAERFGLSELTTFYVMFENKDASKDVGHVALFYVEGEVVYVDPGMNKFEPYGKKFERPEDALKDEDFKKFVLGFAKEVCGEGDWKIGKMDLIRGKENQDAFYYYQRGTYFFNKKEENPEIAMKNIENAKDDFELAKKKGVVWYGLDFYLGQTYYALGEFQKSIDFYDKAIEKHPNPEYNAYQGQSYFRMGNYEKALDEYTASLSKTEPPALPQLNAIATCNFNITANNFNSGKYEETLRVADVALDAYAKLFDNATEQKNQNLINKSRERIALLYTTKAKAYWELGKKEEATETLNHGLNEAQNKKLPTEEMQELLLKYTK